MPTPKPNEKKKDFINRCVPYIIENEGMKSDQAYAVCIAHWNDRKNNMTVQDAKCTELTLTAPVKLSEEENGGDFEIEAYTGATVDRWWGKLAIAVDGIQAKAQIPILMNHDAGSIVGYSIQTKRDTSFRVRGKFSTVTEEAQRVKGLAAEGFPWQASIGVRPLKVVPVEAGAEFSVNGGVVSGPAEIWAESEVFETSFVPLGADGGTSVAMFSRFEEPEGPKHKQKEEEEVMSKVTMESLAADSPELLAEVRADGAKVERERIQAVLAQSMPGHEALLNKLAFDGKTTGPEAAVQVLAAERGKLLSVKEDLKSDAVEPVPEIAAPEPKAEQDPVTAEAFALRGDLVEEFGSFETYKAFLSASQSGLVKIMKKEGK